MKIIFGADHAGFEMKEALVAFVRDELGYAVEDMGAYVYDEGDDYPDFVKKVAPRIAGSAGDARGIILGGSGQGEAMVANRFRGVRAAVYYGSAFIHAGAGKGHDDIIRLSREHNDANVLSLGARLLSEAEAKEAVRLWLATPSPGEERHIRRIGKIDEG